MVMEFGSAVLPYSTNVCFSPLDTKVLYSTHFVNFYCPKSKLYHLFHKQSEMLYNLNYSTFTSLSPCRPGYMSKNRGFAVAMGKGLPYISSFKN